MYAAINLSLHCTLVAGLAFLLCHGFGKHDAYVPVVLIPLVCMGAFWFRAVAQFEGRFFQCPHMLTHLHTNTSLDQPVLGASILIFLSSESSPVLHSRCAPNALSERPKSLKQSCRYLSAHVEPG